MSEGIERPSARCPIRRTVLVLWILAFIVGCPGARAGEAERIAELLGIGPGMTVADVGAGEGEWTVDLARAVGPRGRVIATEVDGDLVEEIREVVAAEDLDNVETVQGDQSSTGLPPGCCEAVLLRLVYHHFTDPGEMRKSLERALRPGGRLLVIDIEPQTHWRDLPEVPERGGHGIPLETLVGEMTNDGWKVESRHPDWFGDEDRYAVVFRRGS